ncbi:MAG TPA: ABC transporter ATP-binding protein [Methylomirabilota bacterium]|nr:ABC transporter ATP-binding protein [Methylomirabilota bacterium]
MTGSSVLEVIGLRKAFGGIRAVDGVDLCLGPGERRALIGPNGAGKTTLFDLLTGHLAPDAGAIRFHGERLDGLPPHRVWRRGIARTFQIPAVFANLTVRENVQVALLSWRRRTLSLRGRAAGLERERAGALLGRVGLADHAARPAGVLPYGDLKKLELSLALANEPQLLLLDEPTAGMAPAERRALMALVGDIARERGLTLLFTEHDMDIVFAVADRVTVLHQGRVIADGPPAVVRADAEVQRVYLGAL